MCVGRIRTTAVVAVIAALCAAPVAVFAEDAPQRPDAQLQADIQRRIASLKLRSSQVSVEVRDHIVALDGRVRTLWDKLQVVDVARQTAGIERVDSTLQVARAESDSRLAEAVSRELQRDPRLGIYDYAEGSVRNGVVTLAGAVTDPDKSTELVERIEKIPGVQDLDNRIVPLPLSPFDERIRVEIGSRIYGDPQFSNYSAAAPPIHIIVENGHVTLFGWVVSSIDRRQAESAARGVSGVFTVDDRIQVTSAPRQ